MVELFLKETTSVTKNIEWMTQETRYIPKREDLSR